MCLARPWLDTVLLEHKLGRAQDFFASISEEPKINKTVLPVFFRKADACMVTRKAFQTMCELNPQLGRQLQVLLASPGLVTGGFFFREGYPAHEQDLFVAELAGVRKTPAGNQVLTVFQTDDMKEYQLAVFDSAAALMGKYHWLLGETNAAGHLVRPLSLTETTGSPK
jgi:phosphonate transport system substrate-binding protein